MALEVSTYGQHIITEQPCSHNGVWADAAKGHSLPALLVYVHVFVYVYVCLRLTRLPHRHSEALRVLVENTPPVISSTSVPVRSRTSSLASLSPRGINDPEQ